MGSHEVEMKREDCGCCFGAGSLPDIFGDYSACMTCNGKGYFEYERRTVHELKILPEYFYAANSMLRPFEVRQNDRNYAVGDTVILKEYVLDGGYYTGRQTTPRLITYVFEGQGWFADDCVVLGLQEKKLTFDEFAEFFEEEIYIANAESGADRELDFDSERDLEERYSGYLACFKGPITIL